MTAGRVELLWGHAICQSCFYYKKTADDSTQGSPGFQSRTSANESISELIEFVNVAVLHETEQIKRKKDNAMFKTGTINNGTSSKALSPIQAILQKLQSVNIDYML